MVAVVALIALLVGFDHRRRGRRLTTRPAVSEFLTLTDDDGKLFRVRVLNTGEMRVRRSHRLPSRKAGYTQAASAARAGFSESTARRVEAAPLLPSPPPPRQYRTRVDPFQEVWRAEIVPLLERMPGIRATTVLEELQRLHPGRYPDAVLRSLQRRMAQWRATEGPERDLIFRQEHPPGRQALSDFTHADGFTVTI